MTIDVHLVDGTYELFRYHYAPNNKDPEFGATRGCGLAEPISA